MEAMKNKQMSLMDGIMSFGGRREVSRAAATLDSISKLVNWETLVEIVSVLDRSGTSKGGRPPISFEIKLRMLFLQHMFNLSDEELEDQVIDRLSFQRFAGLSFDEDVPDFTCNMKVQRRIDRKWIDGQDIFSHSVGDRKKGVDTEEGDDSGCSDNPKFKQTIEQEKAR